MPNVSLRRWEQEKVSSLQNLKPILIEPLNNRDQLEWNQISNNVKPDNNYVVLDLEPATWYRLRITAHNSAGFTVEEYDFATLTVTGGKCLFSDC